MTLQELNALIVKFKLGEVFLDTVTEAVESFGDSQWNEGYAIGERDALEKQPKEGVPALPDEWKEKIEAEAIDRYCSPYGKPNPETYAFKACAEWMLQQSVQASPQLRWVKASEDNPKEDGFYHVTVEDFDKNRYGSFISFKKGKWDMSSFGVGDEYVVEWLEEASQAVNQTR